MNLTFQSIAVLCVFQIISRGTGDCTNILQHHNGIMFSCKKLESWTRNFEMLVISRVTVEVYILHAKLLSDVGILSVSKYKISILFLIINYGVVKCIFSCKYR